MRRAVALGILVALVAAGCDPDPLPGYHAAAGDERAALVQVVRDYYSIFDRAQVTGDVTPLYALHPKLTSGEQRRSGVNTESFTVERTRASSVTDVHTDLEWYEPMRVFLNGDAAVVYVHGLFTWTYGNASETKGELPVRLDLERYGGKWTITRTDEQVLGETPAPTPR